MANLPAINVLIAEIGQHLGINMRHPRREPLAALFKAAAAVSDNHLAYIAKKKKELDLKQWLDWFSKGSVLDVKEGLTEDFLDDPYGTDAELAKFIRLEAPKSSAEGDDGLDDLEEALGDEDDFSDLDLDLDESEDEEEASKFQPPWRWIGIGLAVIVGVLVFAFGGRALDRIQGSNLHEAPAEEQVVSQEVVDTQLLVLDEAGKIETFNLFAIDDWHVALGLDSANGFEAVSLDPETQTCSPLMSDRQRTVFKILTKPGVVGYRTDERGICFAPTAAFQWVNADGAAIAPMYITADDATDILAAIEQLQVQGNPWSLREKTPITSLAIILVIGTGIAGLIQLFVKKAWETALFLVLGLGPMLLVQLYIPPEQIWGHFLLYFGSLVLSLGLGSTAQMRDTAEYTVDNVTDLGDKVEHRMRIFAYDRSFSLLTEWTYAIWHVGFNLFMLLLFPGTGSLAAITANVGGTVTAVVLSFVLTVVFDFLETKRRNKLAYYSPNDTFRSLDYVVFGLSIFSGILSLISVLVFGGNPETLRWAILGSVLLPWLVSLFTLSDDLTGKERIFDGLMACTQYGMYVLMLVAISGGTP